MLGKSRRDGGYRVNVSIQEQAGARCILCRLPPCFHLLAHSALRGVYCECIVLCMRSYVRCMQFVCAQTRAHTYIHIDALALLRRCSTQCKRACSLAHTRTYTSIARSRDKKHIRTCVAGADGGARWLYAESVHVGPRQQARRPPARVPGPPAAPPHAAPSCGSVLGARGGQTKSRSCAPARRPRRHRSTVTSQQMRIT